MINIKRNWVAAFWFSGFLLCAESAHGDACEKLNSTQAVLSCALERHPSARVSALATEQAIEATSVAKQAPNPELNSQSIFGGETSNKFYSEFNFTHTFELGGKRDSRIKRAAAEVKLIQALQVKSQEEVYLESLIALYRLRQIQEEIGAIDDALQTFTKIAKQYRARPKLSPDQRASLRIFEMAEQDYKMKRSPLEVETDLHLRELELSVGQNFVPQASTLPKRRKAWPLLPSTSAENSKIRGTKLLEAEALLARARADLEVARSAAWPDLKIGPTINIQRQTNQSYEAYGFNFTLPLPLYHRNAAGEIYASKGLERASLARIAAERESEDQKAYFRKRYQSAVGALTQSASAAEIAKKHDEVEKLFSQGFLNGMVLVEIHRQVSDFTKTQNEQELAAVESLVRYYALEGKFFEVTE